ncbi:MAG: Zn-ribbon domain-containing OB-fold protein, partial [Alphaproteobacteria bacterium]
ILSWVIFHKRYFDDFPPPYNSVAVRLEEGPIIMSNLVGQEPEGSWIGKRVRIEFVEHDGRRQHAVRIDETA